VKKLILLILAAALLLAGCGKTETPASPAEESPSPAPSETPAPTPEPEKLSEDFIQADRTEEIRSRVAQAAEGVSLREELARIDALAEEYGEYVSMADTQADATRLKDALSDDVMKELTEEELRWIGFRDEAAQEAVKDFEGGSIHPMLLSLQCADLTRNRTYFLASMLARAVNEPFELPARGICGQFLDTAGTAKVYKRLVIAAGMESGYEATLTVAGKGTLQGTATPAGEGRILFESYDGGVTAEILYGWTGASFTVTRSSGGAFSLGEVYILPTAL
jgi:uncharacterized protein YecT (DUF1311 family)